MTMTERDVVGGVRILTLDHAPANTLSFDVLRELHALCDAANNDDSVRAVILTGRGPFFSGGLDLAMLSSGADRSAWNPATFGRNDGVFALWTLPKPTIAMVNGHAIAGGAILALACDVRIAAGEQTRIGLNELAIGIAPPRAAYEIARLALSSQKLWRLGLAAELHDADRAREVGMIDEVVRGEELEARCISWARRLGSYPREAYAYSKRLVQQEAVHAVLAETDDRLRALVEAWASRETIRALVAQRASLSSGRG
jgi:enoyl-CoA hydratase